MAAARFWLAAALLSSAEGEQDDPLISGCYDEEGTIPGNPNTIAERIYKCKDLGGMRSLLDAGVHPDAHRVKGMSRLAKVRGGS